MVLLQGYPFGYSKSSNLKKSVYFVVTSPDAEYTAIPLAPYNSLPSFCPFIQYVLDVVEKDSIFHVTRIYGCAKRGKEIKRGQLVQFLAANKYENSTTDNFVKKLETELNPFQKYVINQKANIPDSITNLNFLAKLKPTKWKKAMIDIIAPYFKSETYFTLLRYFSGFFLDKFNDDELEFIYRILQSRPDILCFRNLTKRICSEVSISISKFNRSGGSVGEYEDMFDEYKILSKLKKEVKLFPKDQNKDRFYTTSNFSSDYKSTFNSEPSKVEISLGNTQDVKYNPSYPFLSIKLLEYACEDFEIKPIAEIEIIKKALRLYLKCENDRTTFGRTTFSFDDDDEYADTETLTYLLDNKILCAKDEKKRLINELKQDCKMSFSFPEDELKEIELCERLFSRAMSIKVYSADFYGRAYFQALLNVISLLNGVTVVISSGYDTAMDLQANISFDVIPIYKVRDKEVIEKIKRCENLLVEKVNKISTSDLADLLTIPEERFNLIVVGDDKEYSIHPKSGIGELFKSFSGIFVVSDLEAFIPEDELDQMKDDVLNIDGVLECSMSLIKKQILASKATSLPVKQFETASEMIKEYNTIQKKLKKYLKVNNLPSKSRRVQWITSTERSKEEILNELLAKKHGAYNKNQFLLNEFILVHRLGVCGNIKTAHQISTSGGEIPVNSKSSIKLYTGPYKLQITSATYTYAGIFEDHAKAIENENENDEDFIGKAEKPKGRQSKKKKNTDDMEESIFDIDTSIYSISSAEVITIREYNLKPFDYVVFYVTEETRWMDLVIASKYCRYGMIAFVKNIGHMDIAINKKSYNRLTSLESNMVVIKEQLSNDQSQYECKVQDESETNSQDVIENEEEEQEQEVEEEIEENQQEDEINEEEEE